MKLTALIAAMLLGAAPATSATLVIDGNGILTGATGVNVDGSLYDVEFLDGTCASVFNGCDSISDFAFNSLNSANLGAQALLDQVFLGIYDTNPFLTRGCTDPNLCYVLIPTQLSSGFALGGMSINQTGSGDGLNTFGGGFSQFDITNITTATWGRFTYTGQAQVAAVPEPSTWAMMLLGFGGIGIAMRKRRGNRNPLAA